MKSRLNNYITDKEAKAHGLKMEGGKYYLSSGQRITRAPWEPGVTETRWMGVLPKHGPLKLNITENVFEYSEEPEGLKAFIDELEISVLFDGKRKYFADDDDERNCFVVTIKRKNREISFAFGSSLRDTAANLVPSAYDILACCGSDYYCPIDFDDFCMEFGYSNDSIKAKQAWERTLKQTAKLQRIFSEDEANCLPR